MASENKESTTSVGSVAPLTDYADGITTYYLAPHFGRSYPVRRDGDIVSVVIDDDPIDNDPGTGEEDPEDPPRPPKGKKTPTLADIQMFSKVLVYDAAKNPTATVTFKIRNSSGEEVSGISAKVKKL